MLSGCHNHYAYEPQYGDVPNDDTATERHKAHADALRSYETWAPAVAHKKGMYSKEGESMDV
jgi:hypothetical protein